jgi:protein involved in polysaccharide export with SLBB domain
MTNFWKTCCLAVCFAWLSGCATEVLPVRGDVGPWTKVAIDEASPLVLEQEETHTLRPGDRVDVEVIGEALSERWTDRVLNAEGWVSLPRLGPVALAGLDVEAAERRLAAHLTVLEAATTVRLTVRHYASRRVYLSDGSNTLSEAAWVPGLTLRELLETRMTSDPGPGTGVSIVRTDETSGEAAPRRMRLDISTVMADDGELFNPELTPGDVVVLETAGGGGFGDPAARDSQAAERDRLGGYVSG